MNAYEHSLARLALRHSNATEKNRLHGYRRSHAGAGHWREQAIFSVVNAILLKPTPYLNDPRLVYVNSGNKQTDQGYQGASLADYLDWQASSKSFQQLAAIAYDGGLNLTRVDHPEFFSVHESHGEDPIATRCSSRMQPPMKR